MGVGARIRRFASAGNDTTLADHLQAAPVFNSLKSANEMAGVAARTLRIAATPPFRWIPGSIVEASTACRRTWLPCAVSTGIWLIGFGVILFAGFAYTLGVADRDPPGVYTGFLREVNTWITMMIVAGVAGSALTADLGARKIREELDALDVLGVDKFRTLVVPRVIGMTLAAVILPLVSLLFSMVINIGLNPLTIHIPIAVQMDAMFLAFNAYDLWSSVIKHAIMGFFIGVVACQKGLSTGGGAEGVGKAVNQTVVISFFGIWIFNSLYNIAYLTLFPEAIVLKG